MVDTCAGQDKPLLLNHYFLPAKTLLAYFDVLVLFTVLPAART